MNNEMLFTIFEKVLSNIPPPCNQLSSDHTYFCFDTVFLARSCDSFLALHCAVQCTECFLWHSLLRKMCKNHWFWKIYFSKEKQERFPSNQKYRRLRFSHWFTISNAVLQSVIYDYISLSMERSKSFTSIECPKIFWEELFLRGRKCILSVFTFIVISRWPLRLFLMWEIFFMLRKFFDLESAPYLSQTKFMTQVLA